MIKVDRYGYVQCDYTPTNPPTYQAYVNNTPPGTVSLEVPVPWDHNQTIQYILPLDTARELKRELKAAIKTAKTMEECEGTVVTSPYDEELVKRIGEAIAERKQRGLD